MSQNNDNIERTLGKILATQEHVLEKMNLFNEKLEIHIKDDKELEKRIQKTETRLAYASGIIITSMAILSIFNDFILTKLGIK